MPEAPRISSIIDITYKSYKFDRNTTLRGNKTAIFQLNLTTSLNATQLKFPCNWRWLLKFVTSFKCCLNFCMFKKVNFHFNFAPVPLGIFQIFCQFFRMTMSDVISQGKRRRREHSYIPRSFQRRPAVFVLSDAINNDGQDGKPGNFPFNFNPNSHKLAKVL